ncbi:hypothetical protein PVAND_016727 [Polypedilum vanderplanki]|uniref:Uncharacterized protein n=1 Tax=Polypedilum vanderplanki TaxID=319348 RepID=A0A9J6BGH4_POLVA|nr:hypothetical protein PVAND_016727 [Polypedilum vanderplanki]
MKILQQKLLLTLVLVISVASDELSNYEANQEKNDEIINEVYKNQTAIIDNAIENAQQYLKLSTISPGLAVIVETSINDFNNLMPNKSHVDRHRRQAPPDLCSQIKNQLNDIQNRIKSVQLQIADLQKTIGYSQSNITYYSNLYNTTTSDIVKSFALSSIKQYQDLITASNNNIQSLNTVLTSLQNSFKTTSAQYLAICLTTTTRTTTPRSTTSISQPTTPLQTTSTTKLTTSTSKLTTTPTKAPTTTPSITTKPSSTLASTTPSVTTKASTTSAKITTTPLPITTTKPSVSSTITTSRASTTISTPTTTKSSYYCTTTTTPASTTAQETTTAPVTFTAQKTTPTTSTRTSTVSVTTSTTNTPTTTSTSTLETTTPLTTTTTLKTTTSVPTTTTVRTTTSTTTTEPTTSTTTSTTSTTTTTKPTTTSTTTTTKTTSTTTQPTTTTRPPPQYECAVWSRYNLDSAPETNGFLAGNSIINNSPAYVGFGMWGDRRLPGRIQISTVGTRTAGGYVPWGAEQQVLYPEYLVLPNNCSCSWQSPSVALAQPGLILTGDPGYQFAIGLVTYTNGLVSISRVVTDATQTGIYLKQWYIDGNLQEQSNLATQLLVCSSPISPKTRPVINFPTEACAVWSSVGMTNAVSINGLSAGTSRVKDEAYIGRGQQGGQFQVGRYTDGVGTFTAWGGDRLAQYSEWLIIPQGCSCYWMTPNAAKARKGLVTAPDSTYNFMVGRVKFVSGEVSVARVNFANTFEWYTNLNNQDVSDWSSELLVCETVPPPPQGCAVWMRYLGDKAPETIGFSAGTHIVMGLPAYIGFGSWGDRRLPGRIQTSNSGSSTPGVYVSFGAEQKSPYPEFLVVPEECSCSFQVTSIASNRPGLVLTGDPYWKFAIGRKTYTNGRVSITRVVTDATLTNYYMRQWYNDGTGAEVTFEPATELLVCETIASTGKRPTINFPTEACGVWSSMNMINSVLSNGFNAGRTIYGVEGYIGRGQKGGQYQVGRYQNESPTGTYVAWGGDRIVDYGSEWLIVPQNCTCRWLSPNQALARKGLVTAPDYTYNFMVGRVKFWSGDVAVSRVSYTSLTQWYDNLNNQDVSDTASELLVCENIPPPPNGCALWSRYNNDNAPAINGFYAGNSTINNSPVYIGAGMWNDQRMPGRVQISSVTTGTVTRTSGVYVSYGAEVQVRYPEYLVVPDGCSCSWMVPSIASSHPGLILTGDPLYQFAVGLKTFGNGQISIAKVDTNAAQNNLYMQQWYTDSNNREIFEPATQLLVCESFQSTASNPVVKYANEACGVWSSINMINSVVTNGFAIGPSRFPNITAYAGRGQFGNAFRTGRYQNEDPTGAYTLGGGVDKLMQYSQWLILPVNCTCLWMPAYQAIIRKGLVTAPDFNYNYAIGLKSFNTGQVAVELTQTDNLNSYYTDLNNIDRFENIDSQTQLLVCENNYTPPPNACAVWAKYNNDNEPENVGFKAGIAIDGTTAYIGRGKIGALIVPGRVSIGVGVIVPLSGTEKLVVDPEYLVVPDGCSCSWIPISKASNRPGIVQTPDQIYLHIHGIVRLQNGSIALSRVVGSPYSVLYIEWYVGLNGGEYKNQQATDVLVCETTQSTAVKPKIGFEYEACGVWSSIHYANTVTSIGFAAGEKSINNTIPWVGRGTSNNQFNAGRFQSETNLAYVPFSKENIAVASEFLIVPEGCNCKWMDPNIAWIRKGLVHAANDFYPFAVGRVNLTNGQTAISKVNVPYNTDFAQWWSPTFFNELSSAPATELLVCENIPDPSPNPCDLFIQYYGDVSPTINGFSAGSSAYRNAANSTAWVARAFRDSWLIPGRVQITGNTGAIFVTYGDELITNPPGLQKYGEYLVIRDGCSCKWLPPSLASNHLGLVRTAEQAYGSDYVVSRIKTNDGRISIGKTTTPFYDTFYTNPTFGNQINFNPPNEVLVCESQSDMSTKPTLNFGNKACALWSKFKPQTANWAASHGFYAGVDRFGNAAYVGRGNQGDVQWIGRVQITGNVGVYVYGGNEPLATVPEYLVVPNNCNCDFLPYATAVNKFGLVRSIDWYYGFAIGLKNFTSGRIALTSVRTDLVFNNQWYINELGNTVTDTATVLLVCETS